MSDLYNIVFQIAVECQQQASAVRSRRPDICRRIVIYVTVRRVRPWNITCRMRLSPWNRSCRGGQRI
jgi:hypothetical protein